MKRVSTAMIINLDTDEVIRILEVKENEEYPNEMYEFWNDQMEGSLNECELVMVETLYK